MAEQTEDFDKWLAEQADAAHEAIEAVHGQARAKLYADAAADDSKSEEQERPVSAKHA